MLLTAMPVHSISYIQLDGGLLLIGNTEQEAAPHPLLPTVGLTLPLISGPLFYTETGFLLFGTYYQYENQRATPVELENQGFLVIAALIDARLGLRFSISRIFKLGGSAGLGLLLRAPIPLFPDARSNVGPTLSYFYGFRFLYPETELFAQIAVSKDFDLKLSFRAYYPIFHLWDGENLPFFDQFMVSALVGIIYYIR
ncbi:hypothetical protein ES703_106875 [subsurface metagenome]